MSLKGVHLRFFIIGQIMDALISDFNHYTLIDKVKIIDDDHIIATVTAPRVLEEAEVSVEEELEEDEESAEPEVITKQQEEEQ